MFLSLWWLSLLGIIFWKSSGTERVKILLAVDQFVFFPSVFKMQKKKRLMLSLNRKIQDRGIQENPEKLAEE